MAWRAKAKTPSPGPNVGKPRRQSAGKKPTVEVIAQIEKQREDRRKAMAAAKKERLAENKMNEKLGKPGDVDFQRMIKAFRNESQDKMKSHTPPNETKINICVRKRPVNKKEVKRKDYDSVSCFNPAVIVHECKLRVDGITKYLDNNEFVFDHAFGENSTNEEVYKYTAKSLIPFIFGDRGRATVFAYGQTGSGKTFTMEGIQNQAAKDIFSELKQYKQRGVEMSLGVSFFEIYGGRCQDLLHNRRRLTVREDGKGEVQIAGLEECEADTVEELLSAIERANRLRTTHATEVNDQSSRSHGICQISIRNGPSKKLHGRLSLIDLAGSERGADTKSHNRQRRMESAEINTSLLALKECIRALDSGGSHVPFRASKLTLVIKDSFVHPKARTVMIAAISPCSSSTDHTLNTLRYADRVKEKPTSGLNLNNRAGNQNNNAIPIMDINDVMIESEDMSSFKTPTRASQYAVPPTPPKESCTNDAVPPPIPVPVIIQTPPKPLQSKIDDTDIETLQSRLNESTSSQDDIKFLANSLRKQSGDRLTEDAANALEKLHETVQSLYEEEENLLKAHMNSIQENAELLTEEGNLLANIQGEEVVDYDIDAYITRLDEILQQRRQNVENLQEQLNSFRRRLQAEENASRNVSDLPLY